MNIARYIPTLPPKPGGMEEHGRTLSLIQATRHELTVFYILGGILPPPIHTTQLDVRGWRPSWHYLRRALTGTLAAQTAIRKAHRRKPFDLIHGHGELIEAAVLGGLSKKLNIPFVMTVHGAIARRPWLQSSYRWSFQKADAVIAVSPEIAQFLEQSGVPPAQIAVLSSGIDYPALSNAVATVDTPWSFTGLFVGRLHPVKGIRTLLQAAEQLCTAHPDSGIIIVGDGSERASIQAAIQAGLPIRWLGRVPREELPGIYASADCFILPSVTLPTQAEGTPTSIMEAMAAGLPIIATRSGGIPDLVTPDVGILIPEQNPNAIIGAITALCANPAYRQQLAAAAQQQAKGRDWSLIAQRIDTIYQRLALGVNV